MSVTVSRFVRVLSRGAVVTDKLVAVREGKVRAALDALRAQVARLEQAGLKSAALTNALAALEHDRAEAMRQQGNEAKCEALEPVKLATRTGAADAQRQVDQHLADQAELKRKGAEALAAVNAADAAIRTIADPAFARPFSTDLADVQNRRLDMNATEDVDRLRGAIAGLDGCIADAGAIAGSAGRIAAQLAERTAKLGEFDKAFKPLGAALGTLPDAALRDPANLLLVGVWKRRQALANAGPAQLAGELGKAPALLADLGRVAETIGLYQEWGQSKIDRDLIFGACTAYLQQAKKGGPSLKWLADGATALQASLFALVKRCPRDPRGAIDGLPAVARAAADLKDEFNEKILGPPLLRKVTELANADPDSPEAQMQKALPPDEFKERLFNVHHTEMAFGVKPANISPGEKVAVHTYTTNDYDEMNRLLLGIPPPPSDPAATAIKNQEAAKAVAKLPTYKLGPTRRGEREWPGADARYLTGNSFTLGAFWSTGVGFAFPGKYQITVVGTSGRDVAKLSDVPSESEILFLPGTKFRVVSRVDKDANTVLVRVQEV